MNTAPGPQFDVETLTAQELLTHAAGQFGHGLKLACSLGAEDMALLDMLVKIQPNPRVFVLDTGRLHEETYETLDRARAKYGLEFEIYFPQSDAVQSLVSTKGVLSFRHSIDDRKQCCGSRKVEPLNRALSDATAWITGLRREQAVTRKALHRLEPDTDRPGIMKFNPLVDWTVSDVWDYIRANDVPYNRLHDQGFPSIGCAPCTRAVAIGEDVRAGRWWWENTEQKECGLHARHSG